jgi:hypothetical protein
MTQQRFFLPRVMTTTTGKRGDSHDHARRSLLLQIETLVTDACDLGDQLAANPIEGSEAQRNRKPK